MFRGRLLLALAVPLALAQVALPVRAGVYVVDSFQAPGSHFDQIYAAVAAAADGDTILVRAGSYISFAVDGKSLSIVAEQGALAGLIGSIEVRNLGPSQSVLLQGLYVETTDSGVGLRVEDCDGPVWVEDCSFFEPYLTQNPVQGCEVLSSTFVTLARCTSEGSRGLSPAGGGHGLLVQDSTVVVYDSQIQGGSGGSSILQIQPAGHAAYVDDGQLLAWNTTLQGGDGALGSTVFFCTDGGDGGSGVYLTGQLPVARLVASTATGGAAGTADPPCLPGVAGADTIVESGVLDVVPTTARSLDANGPLRGGDTLVIDFAGAPNDLVWWILSPVYAPFVKLPSGPKVGGAYLLGPGPVLVLALDGTGTLQLSGALPPIDVTGTLYMQSVHFGTGGEIVMSSGSALTLLDSSL